MKLYIRNITLVTLFILTAFSANAQKTITFDTKDARGGKTHSFSHGDGKNSVSVGLLSWFNGYVPFYYERSILSMLSVQVGAGLTVRSFGSDLGFALSADQQESDNFRSSGGYDIKDDYSHYKYRTTQPGIYLSFAPKVYYDDDGMDGQYVSPMIEYKMFRYSARKADETVTTNGYGESDDRLIPHSKDVQSEYMRCLDLTVNFGGHYQSRNHIVFGWSTGIGVRNYTTQRLDIGITQDALGVSHYANALQEYKKTKLLFTFNFIIGGWF